MNIRRLDDYAMGAATALATASLYSLWDERFSSNVLFSALTASALAAGLPLSFALARWAGGYGENWMRTAQSIAYMSAFAVYVALGPVFYWAYCAFNYNVFILILFMSALLLIGATLCTLFPAALFFSFGGPDSRRRWLLGAMAGVCVWLLMEGIALGPRAGLIMAGVAAGAVAMRGFTGTKRIALVAALTVLGVVSVMLWRLAPMSTVQSIRQLNGETGLLESPSIADVYGERGRVIVWKDQQGSITIARGGRVEGGQALGPGSAARDLIMAAMCEAMHPALRNALFVGAAGANAAVNMAGAQRPGRSPLSVTLIDYDRDVAAVLTKSGLLKDVSAAAVEPRTYMRSHAGQFDAVIVQPPFPSDSVGAGMYSVEFLESVKESMADGGIMITTIPYRVLSQAGINIIIKNMRIVYPEVEIWELLGTSEYLLAASLAPFARTEAEVKAAVREYAGGASHSHIAFVQGADDVRAMAERLAGVPAHTYNRPVLEYRAAFLAVGGAD